MPDDFMLDSKETLHIVDGDSVGLQMRIQGIDTPELGQLCKKTKFEIDDCGELSTKFLKKILRELPGKLSIQTLGTGYYRRILVRIYKGHTNIGRYMVEQGMAFSYQDNYLSSQNRAKMLKRGFWNFHTPPLQPYKWRKLNPPRLQK